MNTNLTHHWTALFSQSGTEILQISQAIGRFPNVIITDKISLDDMNRELLEMIQKEEIQFIQLLNPNVNSYRESIPYGSIVTLHGYLKIIPEQICDGYEIYNGHPGDIINHPELKGLDPQKKALEFELLNTCCVIHECTSSVDGGEVLSISDFVNIASLRNRCLPDYWLPALTSELHEKSIIMWSEFLREKLAESPTIPVTKNILILDYLIKFI